MATKPRTASPWARRRPRPYKRRGSRPWTLNEAQMLRSIPSLPRPLLARLTEAMIDRMDLLDGDNDVELNGDELDGCLSFEKDLTRRIHWVFAGHHEDDEDDDPDEEHDGREKDEY